MIGKKLSLGDTIGVISPASPSKDSRITECINTFSRLGFNIVEGEHLRDKSGYLAGDDKARAEDLMNMFADPNINSIICFRGGYGSIRTMNYIDWNIIKRNPKIFCGYSDITLLLNYINKKCGLITFHSPMISSNIENSVTKDSLLTTLMYGTKSYYINLCDISTIETFNENNIRGKLCGGNLTMLCSSLGTPFEIDTTDNILLIEDVDEKNYAVDRMLTQLLLANKLHNCKAFIIGYFTNNNSSQSDSCPPIPEVIKNILIPLNKPIILGAPFGHQYPNITLPIGATAEINFNPLSIKITYPVVK